MKKFELLKEKRKRKKKKPNVPVIQPCVVYSEDRPWWDFWESYQDMIMYTQSWLSKEIDDKKLTTPPFIILPLKRWYDIDLGKSRSYLAEYSMLKGATHTLFLDQDNTFPQDAIIQLMKHNKKVISGLYFTHGRTSDMYPMSVRPVMYRFDRNDKGEYKEGDHYHYRSIINWDTEKKLIEVDAIGAGCLLINNNIFKRLQKHLVRYDNLGDEKITGITSMYMYFNTTTYHTEDMPFCNRVRELLKEKIYVDPSVMCGHLQKKVVKGKDFLVSKQIEVAKLVGTDVMRKMSAKDLIEFNLSENRNEKKEVCRYV